METQWGQAAWPRSQDPEGGEGAAGRWGGRWNISVPRVRAFLANLYHISCEVEGGCLLWPVCSLGKTLLAFALLHFVLQGQIGLLLQVSLDFLLVDSSPLRWKGLLFFFFFWWSSNHELLIAKFRLKLKKLWKTTKSFRYDQNKIPYDYTMEVRNGFKGLDMVDRVPEELWTQVHNIV